MKTEDWITIYKVDEKMAPYVVRKGAGARWLAYCQKPTIKVVGVFDTVGFLGYPVNIPADVTVWDKAYQFYNTDIHPGEYFYCLSLHHNRLISHSPEIEDAFQALALDKYRAPFFADTVRYDKR